MTFSTADGVGQREERPPRSPDEARRLSCLKHLGLHEEDIASVLFKLAETRDEREQAFRILHDVYVGRGLCDPCPCGLKMSLFSFLPTTAIFLGIRDGIVLGTMSLIEDSSLGLPMDELYGAEVAQLRSRGRRIAEIGALAVQNGARGRGLTLMLNSLMIRWALFYRRIDDLLITVHPKSADLYRTLYLFELLGGERMYERLKNAPALLLRLDLRGWIARLRAVYDRTALGASGLGSSANLYRFLLLDPYPNLSLPAVVGPTGVAEPPPWDPLDIADLLGRPQSETGIVMPKERTVFWTGARRQDAPTRERKGLQIIVGGSPGQELRPPSEPSRKRILFVGEAMALGNVAKPLALASALDPSRFDVSFACDPRFEKLYANLPFPSRAIHSISSEQFLRSLATSSPIYDTETLRGYVREDLEVIGETAPDAVVGSFRLSLAVSARLANVPYLALTSACWSPYRADPLPFVNHFLRMPSPQGLFSAVKPLALAYHSLPFNRVRRENGQRSLGFDARRVFTEADQTLYCDLPELFPTADIPAHHHYIGPIDWSASVEPPSWWDTLPAGRPEIYLNLGSSGRSELLPMILDALADLPVSVLVATAGRIVLGSLPANAFSAEFLPGKRAAARANLVICNGGTTAYQALGVGVPVLGIAGNMHQTWNMEAIERAGAGRLLRAGAVDREALRATVTQMLSKSSYAEAAVALAGLLAKYDPARRLEKILGKVLSQSSVAA